MPSTVIMVSSYDPEYLKIFESIVRSEVATGSSPIVWDVTPALAMPVDSYHRGVLRLFGMDFPGHDIERRLTSLGARYLKADPASDKDAPEPLSTELEDVLEIAVRSGLITYFRTDKPNLDKRLVRRSSERLHAEGRRVYRAAKSLLAENPDTRVVYLPNGRFPHQKLATLAFSSAGLPTLHIEKGVGPNRMYLQDYAPQARVRSQEGAEAVLAGLAPADIDKIADNWLAMRGPSKGSRNEFSTLWTNGLPAAIAERKQSGAKVAGFFTSSQDEFEFLGPEWRLHTWDNQFAAFDAMITRLERDGYACYLRVHPNLATKAQDCFLREREGVRDLKRRHPGLDVIWHDNPTNTYALLDISDAIVVWYSTIGLEASARGLPVWTAATSRYGLIADVRELLSPEDVERDGGAWAVDPHAAKRFIAYMVLRDRDISDGAASWTSWEPASAPIGAKLAAIAVSGGAPTPWSAATSLVDAYRHRSLRANIQALRRS